MDSFIFPNKDDLYFYIESINNSARDTKKYLPNIDDRWFREVDDVYRYIESNYKYTKRYSVDTVAADILYKSVKRHVFSDGNKRTGVIAVVLFYQINGYYLEVPEKVKKLARKIARSRGNSKETQYRFLCVSEFKKIKKRYSE